MNPLYVGIDVSEDHNETFLMNPDGSKLSSFSVLNYSSARFFYLHFYPVKPNLIGTF